MVMGWAVTAVGAAALLGLAAGFWSYRRLRSLDYRYPDEGDRDPPAAPWWVVPVTSVVAGALVLRVSATGEAPPTAQSPPTTALITLGLVLAVAGAVSVHLAAIDLDVHRLPDRLMWPLLGWVAAGLALTAVLGAGWEPWWRAMLAGAVCGGGYLMLALLTLLTGSLGLGLGDVKLAGLLGMILGWFGWLSVLIGMYAGILIGGIAAGYLLLRRRKGRADHLAYGPAMLLGAAVGVLVPAEVFVGGW